MLLHRWLIVGLLVSPALAEEEHPSLEMLEYLGSLVESDEGLIGPEDFEETDDTKHEQEQEKGEDDDK